MRVGLAKRAVPAVVEPDQVGEGVVWSAIPDLAELDQRRRLLLVVGSSDQRAAYENDQRHDPFHGVLSVSCCYWLLLATALWIASAVALARNSTIFRPHSIVRSAGARSTPLMRNLPAAMRSFMRTVAGSTVIMIAVMAKSS